MRSFVKTKIFFTFQILSMNFQDPKNDEQRCDNNQHDQTLDILVIGAGGKLLILSLFLMLIC